MTELETLLVTVEADLRRYSKQMQQLGQMTDGGFKKAGKAANDGLSTVEQRAKQASAQAQKALQDAQRSSRQFGQTIQNVGYQVGDFFVQIESGQGFLRALTQQGTQVLGAFGPWGAVLGAAAGSLAVLASTIGLFGPSVSEATEAVTKLNDQLGTTDELTKAAAGGYDALIQKVKESTRATREAFLAELAIEGREAEKKLKETAETVAGAMGDINSAVAERVSVLFGNAAGGVSLVGQEINKLQDQIAKGVASPEDFERLNKLLRDGGTASGEATARAKELQEQIASLIKTIESGKATPDQYLQLATILRDLAQSATPELSAKLLEQADNLAVAAGATEKTNDKLKEIKATTDAVTGATDAATKATLNNAAAMDTGTGAAGRYADAIRGAVKALQEQQRASGYNSNPTFEVGGGNLSFGGSRERAPGTMGPTFGNLDPSYLKDEPAWFDSDAINDAINPVKVLGLGFAKVVPEAKEFTDSLKAAEAAAVDLSKLPKTFTIGGGGVNFKGLPNRTDLLGDLFGSESPADLTTSEFSRSIYGKGREKEPKTPKEKRTPEDRAEDRTQALKDEIAYNEQLAAVYGQGIEARNRVTASYEALKEARKTGLAEGSEEFRQFIDTQTAQNVVNLGLEHRLDLMKQGQALTESLMTDQERQNKLLADYQEMLRAGAIGTEIYKRAVAAATSENDNLVEAIGGVGDAIESGIQGATSFADALAKIGLQLLSLLSKGLFGAGPLGGLFNNIFGVAAGGILGTPASAINAGATAPLAGLGTGFRRSFAAGGWGGPGPVLVGESGPEIANMPSRAYISPANATRRMLQGGNDNRPIEINVNGATGNAELKQMVALGVDQAVKRSGRNVPGIQRNYNLRFGP